ncbi:hypothetical protein [Gelidibacter salicanalis]|uniref:ImmA/IrrE family metallo-endopeptidase n=1 Tax=Gelidibacter salicanalis TaxID=291193 RepID=A0A934NI80_9FLAO|nr:hypothetical protein [Gelidibacter salicanalis]MBJ7880753.1 hypothetical protein [Gelidibacter salicanalis]
MKKNLFIIPFLFLSLLIVNAQEMTNEETQPVKWSLVDSINLEEINSDLKPGLLTMDMGVYFPSNFDPAFKKVTIQQIINSIKAAKEIYASTNVQINLLWIKTGKLDPKYFSIQANKIPEVPETEYVNMYQNMYRHPAVLGEAAKTAFKSIVEPHPDNNRTLYLVVLQDVFMPFLTVSEGRNWTSKSVRTGGLSFPSYSYVAEMPYTLRGVITISNLSKSERARRTVAHEIGHKVINVSHEYRDINPENEVFAEGGLMVYGNGEEIPSGVSGRWHLERLLLSPFLYRVNKEGEKEWNPDYIEGGHYYDPLYEDKVIYFEGKSKISKDW